MKIAFVDDVCHKKTNSTEFIVDILKKKHKVKRFWGSGTLWFPKNNLKAINKYNPDVIAFFQRMPVYTELRKFKCKNLLYIPMYDQNTLFQKHCFGWQARLMDWFNLKRQLTLCFSKADYFLYDKYCECLSVQYFPKPVKRNKCKKVNVFFWERVKALDYSFVSNKLLDMGCVDTLFVRQSNDENQNCLPIKEQANIKVVKGWLDKKDYLKLLDSCGIGIAPRLKEGIGHGFLELMARGYCVIANNDSTHNEYIKDGVNGLLFNKNNPRVCLDHWKELGEAAYDFVVDGYDAWQFDKEFILSFVDRFNNPKDKWWWTEWD